MENYSPIVITHDSTLESRCCLPSDDSAQLLDFSPSYVDAPGEQSTRARPQKWKIPRQIEAQTSEQFGGDRTSGYKALEESNFGARRGIWPRKPPPPPILLGTSALTRFPRARERAHEIYAHYRETADPR